MVKFLKDNKEFIVCQISNYAVPGFTRNTSSTEFVNPMLLGLFLSRSKLLSHLVAGSTFLFLSENYFLRSFPSFVKRQAQTR